MEIKNNKDYKDKTVCIILHLNGKSTINKGSYDNEDS